MFCNFSLISSYFINKPQKLFMTELNRLFKESWDNSGGKRPQEVFSPTGCSQQDQLGGQSMLLRALSGRSWKTPRMETAQVLWAVLMGKMFLISGVDPRYKAEGTRH